MMRNPKIVGFVAMNGVLYHGTVRDLSERSHISPRRGAQVVSAYGEEGRPYLFATEDVAEALAHARAHVAVRVGHEPSDREMRDMAAIAVIKPVKADWAQRPREEEHDTGRDHPPEAEPGDWYSPYEARVEKWLVGEELPLARALMANPLQIDNERGFGATPNSRNVDYLGLRVKMRPSVFHKLAMPLPRDQARSVDFAKRHAREGAAFAAPALYIRIPESWDDGKLSEPSVVIAHDGRNRMYASLELYGDVPVETHLFPHGYRRRHLTDEWIGRLRSGLVSESRALHKPSLWVETQGPLFEPFVSSPMTSNSRSEPMEKVRSSFERHFDIAERFFPDLGTIELHEDDAAGSDSGHGSERQFGYCKDDEPIIIAFARKAESLPRAYIDGLMAHEFGHAIEFRYGRSALEKTWGRLPASIERRADAIAERTFGRKIEYGDLDIQCVGCGGKKKRPRKLG